MAGFNTTHDQQQIRRFLRRLPLRALVYTCGLAGWWLGPSAPQDLGSGWRSLAVQAIGLIYLALIEFGLALHAEGLWAGSELPSRPLVIP